MEFAEAKNEIVRVREELRQVENQLKELNKIYMENRKKVTSCENRKKESSKEIKKLEDVIESENVFESVQNIEGFDTLLQEELVAISNGMNKTDYSKMDLVRARSKESIPRWIDLERLVKEVIAFKKLYPGWILEFLSSGGQYDTLPPQTFYRYTYKTPHGHYMSMGGIEHVN
jgi:septal ring factor EnvC (AmiA/AmiB activator)